MGIDLNSILPDQEKGLGELEDKRQPVTKEEIEAIRQHLSRPEFGGLTGYNQRMLERLEDALRGGEQITGGDLSFFLHELAEAEIMKDLSLRNPTIGELLKEYPARILDWHESYDLPNLEPNIRLNDLPPDVRWDMTYNHLTPESVGSIWCISI